MKMKELEEKSGFTRYTIRFYEKNDLIHSTVLDNGYHEYSEEILEELRRIKLLRDLGVSIENIKHLQQGIITLEEVIHNRIEELKDENKKINDSLSLCQRILDENIRYDQLHMIHFFDIPMKDSTLEDKVEIVKDPIQRYLARMLDLFVYGMLVDFIFVRIPNNGINYQSTYANIIMSVSAIVVMLLVEPILLSKFSTTLGKWIFGYYVYSEEGDKVSYEIAFKRTITVAFLGLCMDIPILSLLFLGYNYRQIKWKNLPLKWEDETVLSKKKPKYIVVIPVIALCVCVLINSINLSYQPNFKGDLTIEQYAKNYQYLYNAYGFDYSIFDPLNVDNHGKWVYEHTYSDGSRVGLGTYRRCHPLEFTLENNKIEKIEWKQHYDFDKDTSFRKINEVPFICLPILTADGSLKTVSEKNAFIVDMIRNAYVSNGYTTVVGNYIITYKAIYTHLNYNLNGDSDGTWFLDNGEDKGNLDIELCIEKHHITD